MARLRLEIPPVIPAIRRPEDWDALPGEGATPRWIFILGGSIDAVAQATGLLQRKGWHVFLHVDMIHGLSKDLEGLRFLKGFAGPEGIISTHSAIIAHGKRAGFITLQRIFLLDSQSVATGIQQAQATEPDIVETLPGILPEITRQVIKGVPCPVVAGGLITNREQVDAMLGAGAKAVSTSERSLWPK